MKPFSHLSPTGEARMVDVGPKPVVARRATATGELICAPSTIEALRHQALPKGDVLAVARIAGIQGAKQTAQLIPLCHPLALSKIAVNFEVLPDRIAIRCEVALSGRTGVEMEALTGVSVAALTLYDMLKAVDKSMVISGIHVTSKVKGE